jgi:arginase family enzyme
MSEHTGEPVRDDERQTALETLLLEGLRSSEPTELTRRDWDEIRQEAVRRFEARKVRKKG